MPTSARAATFFNKDGVDYLVLIDPRKLDHACSLEAEHAGLVLVDDAIKRLNELAAWRALSEAVFDLALAPGWPYEADSMQSDRVTAQLLARPLNRLSSQALLPVPTS